MPPRHALRAGPVCVFVHPDRHGHKGIDVLGCNYIALPDRRPCGDGPAAACAAGAVRVPDEGETMKAKLSISGDGNFTFYMTPESDAEREILRRVAECKELTISDRLRRVVYSYGNDHTDHIEIMPMPNKLKQNEKATAT